MKIEITFTSNTKRIIEQAHYFYVDEKFNIVKVVHSGFKIIDEWDYDEVKEIKVLKEGEQNEN